MSLDETWHEAFAALLKAADEAMTAARAAGVELTCAESCTGGLLASALTHAPGASGVFAQSFVVYANGAKHHLLGVEKSVLLEHGAVSEPCARAMAKGARARAKIPGRTLALALTGVAGPDGGSGDKPVGRVYVAVEGPDGAGGCEELNLQGARAVVRARSALRAAEMARDYLAAWTARA